MAFVIKDPPEFTVNIPRWNRETIADGVEMAKVPEALLNNDVYLLRTISQQRAVTYITLIADGWEGDEAPYSQSVPVEGAEETTEAILVRNMPENATKEEQKNYNKAYGILCAGTAELAEGSAVFYVYDKPTTDLSVGLLGIGTGGSCRSGGRDGKAAGAPGKQCVRLGPFPGSRSGGRGAALYVPGPPHRCQWAFYAGYPVYRRPDPGAQFHVL